jgi:hypothetical protein
MTKFPSNKVLVKILGKIENLSINALRKATIRSLVLIRIAQEKTIHLTDVIGPDIMIEKERTSFYQEDQTLLPKNPRL